MPRAVVIRNPVARRTVSAERLHEAARRAPAWEIEVRDTTSGQDAIDLARAAADAGADAILACGGDGTLNGVLNGVRVSSRPDTLVGLLPGGTANVWAHEARLPRDLGEALALLEGGRAARVDLGLATIGSEQRRFLLMCGAGLDAAVVDAVEHTPMMKRRLAQGAFVLAGARVLWRQRPVITVVESEGSAIRRSLFLAVAGNTRLYGGVSRLTSAAEIDDGLLDLAMFEVRSGRMGLADRVLHVGRSVRYLRRGWHEVTASRFSYARASRFVLRPERTLHVQLDGEPFAACGPHAPLVLEVEPLAARLLVPLAANPLYGRVDSR